MARDQLVKREQSGAVKKHPFQGRTEPRIGDVAGVGFVSVPRRFCRPQTSCTGWT